MRTRLLALGAFSLAVLLLLTVAGLAQTTASIKGSVADPTGAAVVDATVTVRGVGVDRTTKTNSIGDYEVPALPPGTYTVEVQKPGFQKIQAKGLVLQVDNNAVQNFALKLASPQETITVEATAPVVEATTVTVGQVIDQRTVQDIPLNGRHFVDLALLIPGTVTPPQNGFLTAPLRGQGSFAFNTAGGREDSTNFMINGINLNDMVQNQVTFQPTINTVSEFKVDNSTYSAEYGRNSGSIVNIATRSGGDQFHGELYDYLRNNWLDARNAFNPITVAQSPFKRNQFGADIGGPLRKGGTYFFLSYEGLRHRQGLPLGTTVLTDAQRATIQAGTSPIAKALLPLIPAANAGPTTFLGSTTAPVNIDQGTADMTHKISDADSLHGYYVFQHDLRMEPGATGGTNIPGFGDTREGHRQVLTLSETHVFGSNLVNEARLGANRIHLVFTPNNLTDPNSVGLAGVLGPNQGLIPNIRISDLGVLFGTERNFPQGRGDTTAVVADTLSWVRGRHSLKFGAEFRDFRNDNFNNDPGNLTFTSVEMLAATSAGFAVDNSARTLGNVASRINQNALDFFAQDSWKVTSHLTFELGVRYAWNMTPSEAETRFVNFVPSTVSLASASQPYAQNNKNFQPRVGFSLDLFRNGSTVLRGAYAYQVDQPITGVVTGLTSNPPFALPISTTAANLATLGASYNPSAATNITPVFVNPNFKNADIQSWNLNIQQQLGKSTALMVGYFGTKGTHLEDDININQYTVLGNALSPTSPANNPAAPASRPFQVISASSSFLPGRNLTQASITERDSNSNSNYHALWVTANRRMSNSLQFNASYTWSHSIDEVSRNLNQIVVQDSTNLAGSRANSDFDVRNRFVANAIYDVPFKGNRLKSGWELAPIVMLQSGSPFNIVLATSNINGAVNTVRPNVSGPIQVGNPFSTSNFTWITNPSVFSLPAPGTFGNLGRNSVVGPNFRDLDLALIKSTKITERFNAQFRVDAFNFFNHVNYGQPGPLANNGGTNIAFSPTTGLLSSSFSALTSTRFPTGDSGSSRQLQLSLRLMF